jgi:NAD(P)-dependent dehydrogenase (short-subunit alcohol dehydrogenase family)
MTDLVGSLLGRTVLVTGGGSGIGRATAARAAREGAAIAVVDRHAENAEETATMIRAAGGTASPYACDVSDDGQVAETVAAANADLGRISGVVTAAGIFHGPDLRPAHEVAVDDFVAVLQVNLVGTFAAIKHALPHLVDGGGAIVTIASTAAIRGHGFGAGYTASKGGVDALTRLLAVQYGPHGVRANCICPGGVDTPMTGGTFATPEAIARAKRTVPLGRHAQPEDIGDVAVFLLGDDARHLTGVTLPVEGGATIA